ncbi:uncharacterized protein LOC143036066 [Oratosquilla oratoria]|uniref:uncharacterized protein LOC143036066 n=1 Tax=Oratosquilla oratoria TaxID=337810 RepID=UPI003F75AC2D
MEEPPASDVLEFEEILPQVGTVTPKDPRHTRTRDQMLTEVPLPDEGGAWQGRRSWDGDLMLEERDMLSMVWRPLIHYLEKDPEYIYWVPPVYRLTLDILLGRKRQLMSTTDEESSRVQSTFIEDSETHMETPSRAEDELKISKYSSSSSRDSGRFSEEDPLSPYMTKTEIYALSNLPLDKAFQKELQQVLCNRSRTFLEEEALRAKIAREGQDLSPDEVPLWSTKQTRRPHRLPRTRTEYSPPEGDLLSAKMSRESPNLAPDEDLPRGQGRPRPSPHLVESPSVLEHHLALEDLREKDKKKNQEKSVSLALHDPELPVRESFPSISRRPDSALPRDPSRGHEDIEDDRLEDERTTLQSPHEDQKLLPVQATRYHSSGNYSHFEEVELSLGMPALEDDVEGRGGGAYPPGRRSDTPVPHLFHLRLSLLGLVGILVLGCVLMAVIINGEINGEQEEMTEYTSTTSRSI